MTHPLRFTSAFVLAFATALVLSASALAAGGSGGAPRVAMLSGSFEVPGPGDPDGAGRAEITLNPGQRKVCWSMEVSGITLPAAAAHIHRGAVGVAGPVLVTLGTPGADGKATGCATGIARALVANMANFPERFYVNVHTSDFPGGAVRGQLMTPGQANTWKDAVELQFLNVSDWHAQLDPLSVSGVGNVGGAAQLSTYFQLDRMANPNTLTLTAGDAYGAAPPLSSFFDERPAVEAMNLMGFDVDTFGNHNFDRGVDHLQEMIDLAEFQYVSANLENRDDNLSGVKDWEMFTLGGVDVAVIGLTNPEAPTLVFPGSFGTIVVSDPVKAARKARKEALKAGADVVVVITHMGVTHTDPLSGEQMGPLVDFAEAVNGFDVIFGDHTDMLYEKVVNGALVQENRSKGATYSRTRLTFDPNSGTVFNQDAEFVTPLSAAVTPDPAIVAMLAPYRALLAAALDGVIGVATGLFPRDGVTERLEEVAIGNITADSMRWRYGTQLALTNGGGLRASLPSSYLPQNTALRRATPGDAPGPPIDRVIGDAFTVLPFGNIVVTRTVTGALLWQALEHSVAAIPAANGRFAQISGFRFTYDAALPSGSRVVSVTLDDGTPILPDSTEYTFATNDFVNAGGDGYTMFVGVHGVTREDMADVLLEYIK
ncbi:MAG TPA: 5'-nucleotidase C-terminal domain-containing protein, partial [Gaiellaceae bacterium]|nr:5'-nucleotidase C-terminal domain-containing protein [Gaiellaceae bacterium]